jgi:hypothetical protein
MSGEDTAREAMGKTSEELVVWAAGTNDNPYRRAIARLELERRVAVAQIETAGATRRSAGFMLASVFVLAVTGIVSALFQYLAWMFPHSPPK